MTRRADELKVPSVGSLPAQSPPAGPARTPPPVPFHLFAGHEREPRPSRLTLDGVRAILDAGAFWTEYQPIVHVRTGRTAAYEALARFRGKSGRPLAPARVFALLHADPALQLRTELTLKLQQVERAPRAPLFVNLDPDTWCRAGDGRRNPFLALFGSAGTKVVVEVTETLATTDGGRVAEMVTALRSRRVAVALDDVGATHGLVSLDALAEAEVIKFDRTLIPRLRHPRVRALVVALTAMARDTGARTVLEGVQSTSDYVAARDLGVDMVQGFLFQDRARVAGR
jgi:EAL domain-containing protein (putative c-di-GMP-specific phosphodiesterase class I)